MRSLDGGRSERWWVRRFANQIGRQPGGGLAQERISREASCLLPWEGKGVLPFYTLGARTWMQGDSHVGKQFKFGYWGSVYQEQRSSTEVV